MARTLALIITAFCFLCLEGCSIRQVAVSRLADALAEGGDVYTSDDDYELVGNALPFSLKTIESLLQEVPDHRELLLTAASSFTQYSYAWVELESLTLEEADPARADELRLRAKKLYLRGRKYALRAVELRQDDFIDALRTNARTALSPFSRENVPELYWLALSWAAAMASDKSDMELVADINLIDSILRRCLELDESFGDGALHEFMITWEGGRSALQGGSVDLARDHFARAIELAGDRSIGALVSLAESVSVIEQDKAEFEQLLWQALAYDVDTHPQTRLANVIAQRRARLLLNHVDNYFLED